MSIARTKRKRGQNKSLVVVVAGRDVGTSHVLTFGTHFGNEIIFKVLSKFQSLFTKI